jgi:hypothetical protein
MIFKNKKKRGQYSRFNEKGIEKNKKKKQIKN